MSPIGGRNRVAAWIVGILCAAVVVGLLIITLPMIPVVGHWIGSLFG